MSKKVLVISTSFYPKISPRSFRTTELVKELCRQGHHVTVMTYYEPNDHDPIKKEFGFNIIDLESNRLPKIKIRKSKPWNIITRGLRRSLNILFEYPGIEIMFKVKHRLKKISSYDLLISIAVPHTTHWGVAWARKKKKPLADIWVADCGDAYMGNDIDSFRKMFYFKYLEKWFCSKADFVTIPSIHMKINFYEEFHHKFRQIPQGFKFQESQKFLKPYKINPKPTFAYSGTFIEGTRDPRPLLDIIVNSGIDYTFHIFTKRVDLVKKHVKESNGRIIVHDYIPRSKLLAFLSQMDFVVNITFDEKKQMPSKLVDYYQVGRPILNVLDCNNPNKGVIMEFLNGDYSNKFNYPFIDQYKIENVVKKFITIE